MRYHELLLEYNIYNQDKLNEYLNQFIEKTRHDNGKKWIKKTLRNYLINSRDYNHRIRYGSHQQLPDDAPDWAKKADKLYEFIPTPTLSRVINHKVDYFNSLDPNVSINMSYDQVAVAADEWVEELNQKASDEEDLEGLKEVMKWKNGFRIVKLNTAQCLNREGKLMQHCVGSEEYIYQIEQGMDIYSLRDPNNHPHVTIESRRKIIYQISGKQNESPIEKYHPYIRKFITKFKFDVDEDDLKNIGLIEINDEMYEINNLPDGLTIKGFFDLRNFDKITKLPDNMTIDGDLDLSYSSITQLPDNLKVIGGLNLDHTKITQLPDNLKVGKNLYLNNLIKDIPKLVKIGGRIIHNPLLTRG